jgi:hypothetical protein
MRLAMKRPCNVSEKVKLVTKLRAFVSHVNIYAGLFFFSHKKMKFLHTYSMIDFHAWLLLNEVRLDIPQGVLAGYEAALKDHLKALIRKTKDETLRSRFEEMLTCPIRDARGNCKSFVTYILGALIKNGIHERYDVEQTLNYIMEKMLLARTETGDAKGTVFGTFEERPGLLQGNPAQARFMSFLTYAINNIKRGKIPRLANVERRPQGTVSIGQGRSKAGDDYGGVSPEAIPAHSSSDTSLGELVSDISDLLRKQERETGLPLVKMFNGMIEGEKTDQQRRVYGDGSARKGREIILQTIEQYARSTDNHFLLRQVELLKGHNPTKPLPARRSAPTATKPKREPGDEKSFDFRSIVSVIERLGRPAGSADLMKYRRRWVEYPPRSQAAGYRNRLEEVLDMAVKEGVLRLLKGPAGGKVYDLGPAAERYRQSAAVGGTP